MVIYTEDILKLISNPQEIQSLDVTNIENLLLEHPYFQSGQLLLAKGFLNIDSIRYNRQLKKAAAYSLDRKKLFKLITLSNPRKTEQKIINKIETKTTESVLEIGTPLQFEKSEHYSFSEWLKLLNVKKIKRGVPSSDNFLKKKTERNRVNKEVFFNAIAVAKESLIENTNLVTPTLAKVYLEQGHYEKAISAYKKLILKYPEKNSFFASQIKLINKLNTK